MKRQRPCGDCQNMDRRTFVKAIGGTALAGAAAPMLFNPRFAHAAPTPKSAAETVVGQLYASLTDKQKQLICMPFDHKLRSRISANWHFTGPL